jgi:hypothetical protein
MSRDLKIGDRVRVTAMSMALAAKRGDTGTITRVTPLGGVKTLYCVRMDPPCPSCMVDFYATEVELVP